MNYYALIALLLLPWGLYVLGAGLRFAFHFKRIYLFQCFFALLLLLGSMLSWVMYDPNFGLDPYGIRDWSYTVGRVESWVFLLAFLLFFLCQIPDFHQSKALPLWRKIGKILSLGLILSGVCAAWFVAQNVSLPWLDIPWSIARALFTLCVIPHALGYLISSGAMRINKESENNPTF